MPNEGRERRFSVPQDPEPCPTRARSHRRQDSRSRSGSLADKRQAAMTKEWRADARFAMPEGANGRVGKSITSGLPACRRGYARRSVVRLWAPVSLGYGTTHAGRQSDRCSNHGWRAVVLAEGQLDLSGKCARFIAAHLQTADRSRTRDGRGRGLEGGAARMHEGCDACCSWRSRASMMRTCVYLLCGAGRPSSERGSCSSCSSRRGLHRSR